MFWKLSALDGNMDVISFELKYAVDKHSFFPESCEFTTPTYAVSPLHFSFLIGSDTLDGEQHNTLGRQLSFDLFDKESHFNGSHADFDLSAAAHHFARSAELGCWKGEYNLGLLYLGWLGHAEDPTRAFEMFSRAAKSGKMRAVRALIECWRTGTGVVADFKRAEELEANLERHIAESRARPRD